MKTMPDWVYNQMIDGLQKLLVLRLQGSPPADAIVAVAAVWQEALTPHTWAFDKQLDAQRLPQAFKAVVQQAQKWVQPAQVIEAIPPRREHFTQIGYTREPIPESVKAARHAQVKQMLNRLAQAKTL